MPENRPDAAPLAGGGRAPGGGHGELMGEAGRALHRRPFGPQVRLTALQLASRAADQEFYFFTVFVFLTFPLTIGF